MDVGMIVGEAMPLDWERWRHICRLVERLGFNSLFRSDHYFNGEQKEAIDVYLSFVMAAEETERIRFGPLVSPITFREPVNVGRMAQQLDRAQRWAFRSRPRRRVVSGRAPDLRARLSASAGTLRPPRRGHRPYEGTLVFPSPAPSKGFTIDLHGTDSKPTLRPVAHRF